MPEHATLAAAVLALAARAGVRTAFGIPGVHNLPFWDADPSTGPRILGVRHEQAAVYAADGAARATGRPGLALLTSGPGAANGVAAFGEAHSCGSPVLVVASEVAEAMRAPDGPRGLLHEMADQAALFAAFGAPAMTAGTVPGAVAQAAALLDLLVDPPSTPGYLGIPTDLLAAPVTGPLPPAARTAAPDPDAGEVDRLAALVAASDRVVLWVGGGVVRSGTADRVAALADRLGAPVITTYAARGVLPGHPLLVDVPPHEPEVAALVADADLLLGIGSAFDGMTTRNWWMPVPPRLAAIGLGDTLARTFPWDVLVSAELGPALDALAAALDARWRGGVGPVGRREPWAPAAAGLRRTVLARLAADPRTAPAVRLVRAVEQGWPADGVVVCDMAVAGYWVGGYAEQPHAGRLQYPVGWGTLGFALPAAIGPAAEGLPTLAVCGDGGPMFALGELATLAQESLPVTVLVVDDGGYGMLRFDQVVMGHAVRGVDLLTPDWLALAGAFGIAGQEVPDVAGLAAALRAAAIANRAGEPRLVLLRAAFHPPRTTSPRWFEQTDLA